MSRRSKPKPHESMRPWMPADRGPACPCPPALRERLQALRAQLAGLPVSARIPAVFRL